MSIRMKNRLSRKALQFVLVASILGVVACGGNSQWRDSREVAPVGNEESVGDSAELGQVSLDLSGVNVDEAALSLTANTVKKPETFFVVVATGTYPGTKKEWTIKREVPTTEKEIVLPKVPTGKAHITLRLRSEEKGILKSGSAEVLVKKGQVASATITLEEQRGSLVIKVQDKPLLCEPSKDPRVMAPACMVSEPAKSGEASTNSESSASTTTPKT